MITPAFSPTATERVLPRLALDFTTAVADARVSTVRAGNTATRINSSGVIELINANLPRFDYNPSTLKCLGQLIEETKTNLLLNSLIDGTNLSTQSVTLSAVAYTLSFYGTGSITISGGHSATVTGSGAYPFRKTYTFTPTAGSSTFTVSGTVQYAQLETGSTVTSFIPTAGTAVARNADQVSMTGTNFSSWYNASEGTFLTVADATNAVSANTTIYYASDGVNNIIYGVAGTIRTMRVLVSGSTVAELNASAYVSGVPSTSVGAYKLNDFLCAKDGGATLSDTSGAVPAGINQLVFGTNAAFQAALYLNGHIAKFYYYPQRLTSAEVRAYSKFT